MSGLQLMTVDKVLAAIEDEICWAHGEERPARIRALTVRQPWASLIADGLKTIEVRTMRTHYRGLLLIHAGKTVAEYGYDPRSQVSGDPLEYPLGCSVAIARLAGCRQLEPDDDRAACADPDWWPGLWDAPESWMYAAWGWLIDDVTPLPHVALRGRQGLWIPSRDELWTIRSALQEAAE